MLKNLSKFALVSMILVSISGSLMIHSALASSASPAPGSTGQSSGVSPDQLLPQLTPGGASTPSEIDAVTKLAQNTGGSGTTWQTIVARIIQMALAVAGTLAFIAFTVAGVLMVTARGNEEQIGKGKQILIWSIIALAVIATSYAVVYGISLLNFSATQ